MALSRKIGGKEREGWRERRKEARREGERYRAQGLSSEGWGMLATNS